MEWQPIETAPKDGTRVLVFASSWITQEPRVMEARYVAYGWGDPVYSEWDCEPTHWMLLPKPPQDKP